ncbi:hypothetical protein EK21DRAFT_95134 [Setomelanomma holmii]|uniref:Uncharacterized protein n=1 Tax=Setomelanomma holmii TaxID=210430 RepID=A0A9P4GUK3_9PLEO|nr:hypothetical protein EK21DRAFT_95134 [Setomelanomma holmii]
MATTDSTCLSRETFRPYIDENGMRWDIMGWYQSSSSTMYLVKYSKPDISGRWTHSLVQEKHMPDKLLLEFQPSTANYLNHTDNQRGCALTFQDIMQVLDMAWCRDWPPPTGIEAPARTKFFDNFFVQLQWKEDNGSTRITWEIAETLMDVMDKDHCMSLLAQWACVIDQCRETILWLLGVRVCMKITFGSVQQKPSPHHAYSFHQIMNPEPLVPLHG